MSKRAKFVLLTWCGSEVGPMQKAKMSLEKTEVKKILAIYAVEHQTADLDEMSLTSVSSHSQYSVSLGCTLH